MSYGRTQEEAWKRVKIKRQLRLSGFTDFHPGEQTRSLRQKLKKVKGLGNDYRSI